MRLTGSVRYFACGLGTGLLLAADVTLYADGGGKAPALPRPLFGRDRVAKLLLGLSRTRRKLGLTVRRTEINGQPGAMFFDGSGLLVAAWTLDIADGLVQTIRSVANPEKLRHVGPPADLRALLHHGERGASHRT